MATKQHYKFVFLLFLITGLFFSLSAQAQRGPNPDDVVIEILNDRGQVLQQYPLREQRGDYRAYLQALEGERYSIRVNNYGRSTVGLVIAVDGRNIITGEKSNLSSRERMYVVGPRQSSTYEGWRTGRDKINRFYFTDAGASYADAWGDRSAMGVIAVAAFAGRVPEYQTDQSQPRSRNKSAPAPGAQSAEPGTGFGESEHSPSREVDFVAERDSFAQYFIKYEWQDSLCKRGVLKCSQPAPRPPVRQERLSMDDVTIQVIDDRGRSFYQLPLRDSRDSYRAYMEAYPDATYALKVRNRSDQRIGLVITVDGRNIISGKRSDLLPNERMYILGPREEAVYSGWRTGKNKVNQFYFTDEGGSYAAAWGDSSAMGVIAVAAYQEEAPVQLSRERESTSARKSAPRQRDNAGTGYGDEEYSPSTQVEFNPLRKAFAQYFIKYEWHESLCEKGVIKCRRDSGNRFWKEDKNGGFAPPPPRRN
jgi:hypothetical protein